MNNHRQVFVWTHAFISLGWITSNGIAGSCVNCTFNFLKNCQTAFQSSCTIHIPTSSVWEFIQLSFGGVESYMWIFDSVCGGSVPLTLHCSRVTVKGLFTHWRQRQGHVLPLCLVMLVKCFLGVPGRMPWQRHGFYKVFSVFSIHGAHEVGRGLREPEKDSTIWPGIGLVLVTWLRSVSPWDMIEDTYATSYSVNE